MNVLVPLLIATTALRPFASMSPSGIRPNEGIHPSVTLDAMPYTRTVTCGTYTLTGDATGFGSDPSAASTSLLLKMGGVQNSTTFTDQSASPKTVTANGGAKIDTVTRKYGSGAYLGTTDGDVLTVPDSSDFDFGSGDFTIEMWTRWTSLTGFATLITQREATSGATDQSFYLGYNAGPKVYFEASANGTTSAVTITSSYTPVLNTWIHFAVVRNGTSWKMYADGVEIGSATSSATIFNSTSALRIADAHTGCGTCYFDGRIDDLRITKGVARYTGAFTPPTELPPEEVWWSASPSGTVAGCTGTTSFSCAVDVDPDATGEGVETITVSAGSATDAETIGFYVDGEHSCFLSQSVNGSYNSGLSNLDAVTTWENLGSSAIDVTQGGAATLKPTFRTSIVGGQPVVRCDGGDRLAGAAAADWTFLYNGTDYTVETIHTRSGVIHTYLATTTVAGGHGFAFSGDAVSNVYFQIYNATPTLNININRGGNTLGPFHLAQMTLDDDGGAGNDAFLYVDGAGPTTGARASTYSASTAQPLTVCAFSGGGSGLSGDLFRVVIYQSALTSTQRGINEAVDEWALGGSLPVTP